MKVLLVNPASPGNEKLFAIHPLGLLALASALRAQAHEVQILDLFSFGGEISPELIRTHDVIGITGMSFQHTAILQIARIIKKTDAQKTVVVGGSHASSLPSLLLTEGTIDFVIRGEAEHSFARLLQVLQDKNAWPLIEGLCYRTEGGEHIVAPALIPDVNALPMPAWDLIDLNNYKGHHHGFFYEREPIGRVLTSRGCPFLCTFCASHAVSGRQWRPLSVERVMAEIDLLVRTHHMRELQIEDDNFTFDAQRAKKVCREIIARNYRLSISFPNGIRTEKLDDELLGLMRKAGVYSVTFGIESGAPEVLKRMRKGLSLETTIAQIKRVKKFGIYAQAFFIIGFPYETRENVEQTIAYALRAPLDAAFFGSYVPLPGSEDFTELVQAGTLQVSEIQWDRMHSFKGADLIFKLTPEEFKQLRSKATKKFYLRPHIFLRMLLRIRGLPQLRALLSRMKATF